MRPPGTGEILFILVLCVVVFSASKVNWMGDVLGAFWRNLKQGARSDDRIKVRPADDDTQRPA